MKANVYGIRWTFTLLSSSWRSQKILTQNKTASLFMKGVNTALTRSVNNKVVISFYTLGLEEIGTPKD